MRALWLAASLLACLLHTSWAMPASSSALSDDNLGYSNATRGFPEFALATEKRQDRVALRILSFGASIMSGVGSTTKDGLRKNLRDALRLDGWEVNMVGSLSSGQMHDSDHEAVPGDIISQAQRRLRNSVGYKPNVVIINLGTNDAVQDVDVSQAGIRMESVLDEIWGAEGMDKTCVMLSTLIPNTAEVANRNRPGINNQFRALVNKRAGEKCIYLADMVPNCEEWLTIEDDFLTTEDPHTHPNDNGHKKMAAIFYQAINQAASDGKIVAAGDFEVGEPFCDKFAGTGVDAGGLTQRGSGYDDDTYSHDSVEMPVTWTFDSKWDRHQWTFARLFSPDYDDLVAWVKSDGDYSVTFAVWANSADGKGKFTKIDDMDTDNQCDQWGMRFIDMTGNGLDDFVCNRGDNNVKGVLSTLSINQGDGDREKNKPPTFKLGGNDDGYILGAEVYLDDIILGDIDGDGKGDYGYITRGDDGISVYLQRNGGVGSPEYWQPLGKIFNSGDPKAILRFEDLNGDGRDDWLAINEDGGVATNINARSCRKGVVGNGLNVAWRKGTLRGEQGLTHLGPQGAEPSRVHFARIYGEASAFGNLPKQDYVYMQHSKVGDDHRFEMRVWKNLGKGGTKIRIDGNKYCNMMGHADGSVDYVWAYQGGEMEMWSNRGKNTITDDDKDGFWDYQGIIWSPPRGMHRKDLHLADWNGDGYCDIIYVDPGNNAVEVWLNERPQKGTWEWTHLSNPAPGVTCSETRGIGIHDLAVRFADLTGNSRADYMCIKPDGHVSAFLHHEDGSWENAGQIKSPEGKDRANLRWADVNGDGLDDMIWIEKFSGDSWVWYNGGRGSPETGGGSSFYWRRQDEKAYAGLAAGSCIFYADLDGSGRADEHYVLESFNNVARTSMSPSCGLSDVTGDDDVMDGDLPTPPTGIGLNYNVEWTTWGDSYASGVGSGAYIDGRRCLRYANAYPIFLRDDPDHLLTGLDIKMNYVACSGAKAEEVTDYQLYNTDQASGQPSWQYYPRPSSGKPSVGTLTVGGDDIDFPGILNNCIIEGFPAPLSFGFTNRTCDVQRALTWSLISENGDHDKPNLELIAKIDSTIKSIVNYVHSRIGGNIFHLYVTGYGRFFNDEDPGCDTVTFARLATPKNDGKPHILMTRDLRRDFNSMTLTLNAAIKQAVSQNHASSINVIVRYIDIDGLMGTGHRFCEPGIQEPDQDNPNLWFFHYPYNTDDTTHPTIQYLNSVQQANVNTLTWNPNSTLWVDYLNEFWSQVDETQLNQTVAGSGDENAQFNIWPDIIGYRAKVFHPQVAYHKVIYDAIAWQYRSDLSGSQC